MRKESNCVMSNYDDEAILESDLYDISDVVFEIKQKRRREIALIATSETDFNLMKYYLALKNYIEQIEHEIGVMDSAPEVM